jgi:hypothetical protein
MLIGCCDSRVSPEVIFDAEPGELFIVAQRSQSRAALRAGTSAAPEFGVMGLNTSSWSWARLRHGLKKASAGAGSAYGTFLGCTRGAMREAAAIATFSTGSRLHGEAAVAAGKTHAAAQRRRS